MRKSMKNMPLKTSTIATKLLGSDARFIVITGVNGVGKTKLLKEYYDNHHSSVSTLYKGPEESIGDLKAGNYEHQHRHEDVRDCNKCIQTIKNIILGNTHTRDPFDREVSEFLIKRIESGRIEDEEVLGAKEIFKGFSPQKQKEYIVEAWSTSVSYGYFSSPTKYFLGKLVTNYTFNIEENSTKVKQAANFIDLFRFYSKNTKDGLDKLSIEAFAQKINDDKQFFKDIVARYGVVESKINEELIKNINKELGDINFKYRFYFDQESKKVLFKTGDDKAKGVDLENLTLSSGEEWMLGVVLWKYGIANNGQAVKLMILDEPDRHLDPKLCKEFLKIITKTFAKLDNPDEGGFIKVIMTTHRIDTVALAPDDSIFTVRETGHGDSCLEKTHKLLALSRLSTNLQQITGLQIKVYTEAVDDKIFFECIYAHLIQYRHTLREEPKEWWRERQFTSDDAKCLSKIADLSGRYSMSFYPSSDNQDRSGGWTAVEKMVSHGNDIYKTTYGGGISHYNVFAAPIANLFRSYGVDTPLGIIDMDDGKHKVTDRIMVLPRYSIENFICDPILVGSVVGTNLSNKDKEEVKHFFSKLRDAFTEHKSNRIMLELEKVLKLKSLILPAKKELSVDHSSECEESLVDLFTEDSVAQNDDVPSCNRTNLQQAEKKSTKAEFFVPNDRLDSTTLGTLKNLVLKELEVSQAPKKVEIDLDAYKFVWEADTNERLKDLFKLGDTIKKMPEFTEKVKFLSPNGDIITFDYPEWFIKGRGHDIYDLFAFCFGDFKNALFKHLYQKFSAEEKITIPLDLANIFCTANKKIVEQIRKEIKPDAKKVTWIEKIGYLKSIEKDIIEIDPISQNYAVGYDEVLTGSTAIAGED
jgi:energy-coupling factor transporter ATP-binding protein EcfA2